MLRKAKQSNTVAQVVSKWSHEKLQRIISEHRKLLQKWRPRLSYLVQPRMKWKVCRWSVCGFWLDAAAKENKVQQMWEQTKIKHNNNKTLMLWCNSIPHTTPALLFIWLSFIWLIYFPFTRSHANSIKSHPPHSLCAVEKQKLEGVWGLGGGTEKTKNEGTFPHVLQRRPPGEEEGTTRGDSLGSPKPAVARWCLSVPLPAVLPEPPCRDGRPGIYRV